MTVSKYKVTKNGMKQLKTNLNELYQKLVAINKQLEETYYEENSQEDIDFSKLITEKMYLQSEIDQISQIIESAIIVAKKSYTKASLGSTLRLENHEICYIFQLVDKIEANPLIGRISVESPLGQCVLGKKVGEDVIVSTPAGKNNLKIVAIH